MKCDPKCDPSKGCKECKPIECKGEVHRAWLIALPAIIALLVVAFLAGMWWTSDARDGSSDSVYEDPIVIEAPEDIDVDDVDDVIEVVEDGGSLNVNWLPVIDQPDRDVDSAIVNAFHAGATDLQYLDSDPYAFKLGVIDGGIYDGMELTMQHVPMVGMGTFYNTFYVIVDPEGVKKSVVIDRYAASVGWAAIMPDRMVSAIDVFGETGLDVIGDSLVFDTSVTIDELEPEGSATDVDGNTYTLSSYWHRADYPTDYPLGTSTTVTLDNGDELILHEQGDGEPPQGDQQFVGVREDGRLMFYDLDIPFWLGDDGEVDMSLMVGSPAVTWNDGSENRAEYLRARVGGCGASMRSNVVDIDDIDSEMLEVGTYTDFDGSEGVILGPEKLSGTYYDNMFTSYDLASEEGDINDLEDENPFFYYQDAFDRWIEFRLAEIIPSAECGKPVIYLYPEEETKIDVKLDPAGGFSVTEPEYGDGWSVLARPDGSLVNLADGVEYPYLFWEGQGADYAVPQNYWVVERGEVYVFLVDTLHEMGFNAQEIADFNEFWVPRMQDAPYYKIGFHGNDVMDVLAPMELSVEADSVLRVLMDYTELEGPIEANPLKVIPKFERNGFTVTEWGGVLR